MALCKESKNSKGKYFFVFQGEGKNQNTTKELWNLHGFSDE